MAALPTGTVTFLFTDIEGSVVRWEQYPTEMQVALAQHDAILRDAIDRHDGVLCQTAGDSFVDLASITDAGLVVPSIATVLGVSEGDGRSVADAVADAVAHHLASREVLLVLEISPVPASATRAAWSSRRRRATASTSSTDSCRSATSNATWATTNSPGRCTSSAWPWRRRSTSTSVRAWH